VACVASIRLYQRLEHFGFKNISRFAGGLRKWEENGNTFVGEKVI
jgi:3-mercaptopyruvate sulfurtransferase SseA